MEYSLKKILAILSVIGILPVAYIFYQLTNLSDDEKILNEIYSNQLDAVLFSVNQYSNDIVSSWVNKTSDRDDIKKAFQTTSAVSQVYLIGEDNEERLWDLNDKVELTPSHFKELLVQYDTLVRRLTNYQAAGYQKIENIGNQGSGGNVALLFALDATKSKYTTGMMVLDPINVIQQVLGPKMQSIGGERFIIAVRNAHNSEMIYSTDEDVEGIGNWQSNSLWLLPNYEIAIRQKGITIQDILMQRRNESLIVLTLLLFILVFGAALLFRNVKREVELSVTKSEFVSNVSHELRTPLSLISMFAETLEMGRIKSEEKKQEYYAIIGQETGRLSRIVDNILNFSRLEEGKADYEFEKIYLDDICDSALSAYKYQLKEQEFQFNYQVKDKVLVLVDQEAVKQVFTNLLENAMKFSLDEKHIAISIYQDKRQAVLEVEDHGIGISKHHHREIFGKFYRTPSHDVHNVKGSGLGLSIVKNIVDAHKGTIEVESKEEKGSIFRLKFPIID